MPPQTDVSPTAAQPPHTATQDPQLSYNSVKTRLAFGYYDNLMDFVFRLGFSTVFLANSWTAVVDPGGFLKLIENNILARMVGHFQLQLYMIVINDFILGLLILAGFKRKLVYVWAGAWLLIVTFFKITSLI
jgi:uncharacterized membrane protein YphA (DoxX/SURF4 family)